MNSSSNVYIDYYQSPIGDVEIRATDTNLTHVGFVNKQCETKTNSITQRAVQQLAEYFTGQRTQFELPLGAVGTQFQTYDFLNFLKPHLIHLLFYINLSQNYLL